MKNYPDDTFLARWLSGELSEAEKLEFEQSEDCKELSRLLKGTEMLENPVFNGKELLTSIKTRTQSEEKVKQPIGKLRLAFYFLGAAAAVFVLLTWIFYPDFGKSTYGPEIYSTLKGEVIGNMLPDSSIFRLNSDSRLTYYRDKFEDERNLDLEGEAYFEVKKGQVFSIHTTLGIVEVLGTRFNVDSRENILKVSCYEGSVKVQSLDSEILRILEAGEELLLEKKNDVELLASELGSQQLPQWMEEVLVLSDVPIEKVLETLEKLYPVNFENKNVDLEEIVTASFPKNNLDQSLRIVFSGLDIKWKKKAKGKILIYRE